MFSCLQWFSSSESFLKACAEGTLFAFSMATSISSDYEYYFADANGVDMQNSLCILSSLHIIHKNIEPDLDKIRYRGLINAKN